MPLDPDLKKLLGTVSAIEEIDLDGIDATQFRQMIDAADLSMKTEVINLPHVEDLKIPVDGGSIEARFYSDSPESNSLILFFHGGGFVFGNVDTHDSVCRLMAKNSGCKVLSVNYRLAPEHKFPTAVLDAYSAYTWAREHATDLGIDRSRIGLSGDSAGANLCAVLSLKARNEGVPAPSVQVLFYPVVGVDYSSSSQREFSEGYFLSGKLSSWFLKQYTSSPSDLLNPYFSILGVGDLSNLPETLVFTAEFDPLRDQGETFVSRLKASGTKASGIRALGMIHGFISFFEFSGSARDFLVMGSKFIGYALQQ